MVRVLGRFNKRTDVVAVNGAAIGNGTGDGTVDKSKVALASDSPNGKALGAAAIVREMTNERIHIGLTSASGCHDSKQFSG